MLHQIRKMIGFVCSCMRGLASDLQFETIFDRKKSVLVPVAPACGIYMSYVFDIFFFVSIIFNDVFETFANNLKVFSIGNQISLNDFESFLYRKSNFNII